MILYTLTHLLTQINVADDDGNEGTNNQTSTAPGGGVGGSDNISVNNPFDEPVGSGGVAPASNATVGGGGVVVSATASAPPPISVPQPHPPHPPNIRPPYPPGGPYPPPVSRTPGTFNNT